MRTWMWLPLSVDVVIIRGDLTGTRRLVCVCASGDLTGRTFGTEQDVAHCRSSCALRWIMLS